MNLKPLAAALVLFTTSAQAQTIDHLSAGATLTGTELLPMFQTANPAVTTTPNALKTFIGTTVNTGPGATGGTCNPGATCTIQTTLLDDAPASGAFPYAIPNTDYGKNLIIPASGGSVTIVAATTAGYGNGFFVCAVNEDTVSHTITPATSTISGNTVVTVLPGKTTCFQSDGTNYHFYSAPSLLASSTVFGIVEVDGTTITATNGVISAVGGGNALFGTATGNTTNNIVTMSNTTVGVKDSGVAVSSLAPLASPALTGSATAVGLVTSGATGFTSTTTLVPAAGTLGVAGTSAAPTFGSNSEGAVYLTSANGLSVQGQGSTSDFSILDKGGSVGCSQLTSSGTTPTWNCAGPVISTNAGAGFSHSPSNNSAITDTFGNLNAGGTSATYEMDFKSNSGTNTIIVNGHAHTGGNGNAVDTMTINGAVALFLQGAGTNAIGINSSQLVTLPAITTDAALTDTTVCQDTTAHGLHAGSGTAGICLGNVSSIRFKHDWQNISDGLAIMNGLDPSTYRYNEGIADGGTQLRVGFSAERYADILPQFTRYDGDGRPNGLDMLAAFPYAVRAIQQLDKIKADKDDVAALKEIVTNQQSEIEDLERLVH